MFVVDDTTAATSAIIATISYSTTSITTVNTPTTLYLTCMHMFQQLSSVNLLYRQ